jgi:tellurite resistance protein
MGTRAHAANCAGARGYQPDGGDLYLAHLARDGRCGDRVAPGRGRSLEADLLASRINASSRVATVDGCTDHRVKPAVGRAKTRERLRRFEGIAANHRSERCEMRAPRKQTAEFVELRA